MIQLRSASTMCLVLLTASCVLSPAARADFIINGSFEAGTFTGSGPGYKLGITDADVPGWHIPASDGTYPWGLQNVNLFSAGPAADGNQWIVLGEQHGPNNAGVEYTIQQTMHGLVAGNTYHLTFDIASELGCCAVAEVSFLSGSSTAAQDFTAPGAGITFWNPWGLNAMDFLATNSDVTLQFKDDEPTINGYDLGLDNVHVNQSTSVVPEPRYIFLLTAILGVMSFAGQRKLRSRTRQQLT